MGVATLTGRKKYTNSIISKFYIPGTEPKGCRKKKMCFRK